MRRYKQTRTRGAWRNTRQSCPGRPQLSTREEPCVMPRPRPERGRAGETRRQQQQQQRDVKYVASRESPPKGRSGHRGMAAQSPAGELGKTRNCPRKHQLSILILFLSLVDILGTGAWRGLSRVPVSGCFSGADMISGIKDRLIWQ